MAIHVVNEAAGPLADSTLRCVTLEDLVALKLYAGGRHDLADIEQLLANNPDADVEAIRATAAAFDREGELEGLIASARGMTRVALPITVPRTGASCALRSLIRPWIAGSAVMPASHGLWKSAVL